MYLTNDEKIAKMAEDSGVDWIFVDLEINGKEERQGHLDTVISKHSLEDIKKIKKVLTKSKLMVRINPMFYGSKNEIDKVVEYGADIIMLPFFKKSEEVKQFIEYVNKKTKTCLLLETPEAVENIESILEIEGIDYLHVGLNDLHLGYKKDFMFELLADGTVEMIANKVKEKGIEYGFGGIAKIGEGNLPAENIIAEHYRLGSKMVILSRSFCDAKGATRLIQLEESFNTGVRQIREYEEQLIKKDNNFFMENHCFVNKKVLEIAYDLGRTKKIH